MRLKQFWSHFDLPAKASLVWSRITFSRLTTIYFALACIHCLIQVTFQAHAFSINATAASALWRRVQRANQAQEDAGFAILGSDLRLCYTVPKVISVASCEVIWGGSNSSRPSYGIAAASLAAPVAPVVTSGLKSALDAEPSKTSTVSSVPSAIVTPPPSSTAGFPLTSSPPSVPVSTVTVVVKATPSAVNPTTAVSENANNAAGDVGNNEDDVPQSDLHDKRNSLTPRSTVNATLDDTCIKVLIWPVQRLSDTKREDITFIGFQFWVLGMSIVALLNESIPHSIAALVTHLLATIWGVYQIFRTEQFREEFSRLVTNGACKPNNLLGSYWEQRRNAEIGGALLNSVALCASSFLTYKLVKIYGWQTFKRVGASLTINRIYRLVLSLSICIQLTLFFIVSAMALWIDQLYNGSIGRLAVKGTVYKAVFIVVFLLLIPWLSLGWFAVRRENRKFSFAFLVLSLLFIGLWGAMFDSTTFRWTFVKWEFFTMMAITAGILMISTFILALACRLNFGKGLPRYLNAEEPLDGDDFAPVYPEKMDDGQDDIEKVEFPSSQGRSVPTFSAAFGRGSEVPRPAQMHFGPQRPLTTGERGGSPQLQSLPVGISISSTSSLLGNSENELERIDTRASQTSHKSSASTGSSPSDVIGKRWVIE